MQKEEKLSFADFLGFKKKNQARIFQSNRLESNIQSYQQILRLLLWGDR